MPDVKDMAARLMQAEWDRATIAPFSDADLGIDIEAAYAAQWAFVQSKLDAGYKLIGVKLGLTSWAEVAAGQQPAQRGQDRPVGPGQPRRAELTLEHTYLVPQDEDLGVLSACR
jgi:hypothetical protein